MELNRTAPQTQKDLWQVVTITRDESRGNGSFSRYLTGLLGRRSRGGIGACVCVFSYAPFLWKSFARATSGDSDGPMIGTYRCRCLACF
jgi:hypothetical protein